MTRRFLLTGASLVAATFVATCGDIGGGGSSSSVNAYTFAPILAGDPLQAADADAILMAAAATVDHPNLAIAIVDRVGQILRVYNRTPSGVVFPGEILDVEDKFAVSMARSAAYLSHSQAPLTSRTGQFLSTFHFPGVFGTASFGFAPPAAFAGQTIPVNPTLGVVNTPQAPLWQIDASNRGGMDMLPGPPIPVLTNPDGTVPTPGLGPLPGAVPLYKSPAVPAAGAKTVNKRLVGGIGVFAWGGAPGSDPTLPANPPRTDIMEFAAFMASAIPSATTADLDYTAGPIPFEGAVVLVGILLPYIDPPIQPAGTAPGVFDPLDVVCDGTMTAPCTDVGTGMIDPEGDIVPPMDSIDPLPGAGGLTLAEVTAILDGCETASQQTQAAIRLPPDAQCKMIIAVSDMAGNVIGVRRETDATLFSLEISVSKARNAVFFSDPTSRDLDPASPCFGAHPLCFFANPQHGDSGAFELIDGLGPPISAVDTGIATTARSLGFLSQPFYPPTIDSSTVVGPLNYLANTNRDPVYFDCQGHESDPGLGCVNRSGIIFFPGSAPLYRDGVLVGGIGVSGDGVEQDDYVTFTGIKNAKAVLGFDLEPPSSIRIDNFEYAGVKIPYFKFPQHPEG